LPPIVSCQFWRCFILANANKIKWTPMEYFFFFLQRTGLLESCSSYLAEGTCDNRQSSQAVAAVTSLPN
jgi:hypothetical protein